MVPPQHPVVKDAIPCFRGPALIPRQAEEVRNGKQPWGLDKSLALACCLWDSFLGPLRLHRRERAVDGLSWSRPESKGKVVLAHAKDRSCGYFRVVLLELEEQLGFCSNFLSVPRVSSSASSPSCLEAFRGFYLGPTGILHSVSAYTQANTQN